MTPQVQAMLQQAIQELQGGNFDLANSILKSILQANIDSADTIFKLGMTYANHNKFTEASIILSCLQPYKNDDVRIPYNIGFIYSTQGKHQLALEAYDAALKINPNDSETLINKGATLIDLNNYTLALEALDKAIRISSHIPEAWSNKGVVLQALNRFDEAITHFNKALSLNPVINWVHGDLLHAKMKISDWSSLADGLTKLSHKVEASENVANPFLLLALSDNAFLHKKSAEIYTQSKYPSNPTLGPISKHSKGSKIRVGYFSADFYNHATGCLMAELFELHNKSQFEFFGFSFGVRDEDEMRQRLEKSFDQFIEVSKCSDVEIAQLSRGLNIDIAIDLKGFTQHSRPGIFSYRVAPIQVNYLGYPGTMGADYIDYLIADKILIPSHSEQFYSEKVVYLPHSYQVNDRKRVISKKQFSRQEMGLPKQGFVYCCFNNNHKILPATFKSWMRILRAVDGSVLWLLQDNPWAVENLKKEAQKEGVDEKRLVFAERLPPSEHLARHRQADLFIDTFPYNAHTTASDALWAGLPVLTLVGESFASRVAASLLNAVGITELITSTIEEYQTLAIDLAINSHKLEIIKQTLAVNRLTTPLFDTPCFAKNLEVAYIKMYERYQLDLQPDKIVII